MDSNAASTNCSTEDVCNNANKNVDLVTNMSDQQNGLDNIDDRIMPRTNRSDLYAFFFHMSIIILSFLY